MAKVVTNDNYYKAIADAMREYAPGLMKAEFGIEEILPRQIAQYLGYFFENYGTRRWEAGWNEGVDSEKDRFWDEYQKEGKREDYYGGFGGYGWHSATFYPKYDMKPRNATHMFWYFGLMASVSLGTNPYVDLVERLKECNVELDFSNCHTFTSAFAYAKISHLGVIDTTGATSLNSIFRNAKVTTIDKLILKPSGGQTFTEAFYMDSNASMNLTSVKVTGMISAAINLGQCRKLDKESIESFFNALSAAASARTATFSKAAVDKAFETNAGVGNGSTSAEWAALANTKSNWTIILA